MRIVCRHALLVEAAILCGRSLTAVGRYYNIIRSVVLNIQYLWFRPAPHFVTLFRSAPQIRTAFCQGSVSNLSSQRMNVMHVLCGSETAKRLRCSLQILKSQNPTGHSKSAGSIYKRRFRQTIVWCKETNFVLETIYCKNDNLSHNSSFHNHVSMRRVPASIIYARKLIQIDRRDIFIRKVAISPVNLTTAIFGIAICR